MNEYEEIIDKNLQSVTKSDIIIQTMDTKIQSFKKIIDRSDRRVEKITKSLQKVEENTMILKSRENEIEEVKDRFNELEGFSALIEKRIDQTHAMFNKIETLRNEIDNTDNRLQGMFDETNKKMKFRPMKEEWVIDIRDQVKSAGLPFMFKHWPGKTHNTERAFLEGKIWAEYPQSLLINMNWK